MSENSINDTRYFLFIPTPNQAYLAPCEKIRAGIMTNGRSCAETIVSTLVVACLSLSYDVIVGSKMLDGPTSAVATVGYDLFLLLLHFPSWNLTLYCDGCIVTLLRRACRAISIKSDFKPAVAILQLCSIRYVKHVTPRIYGA
uniref:Uncharacterized protein n=1 Tax=Glossina austeni TaxID=7395 RepID=A0A1A9VBY8_GLOAU